MALIHNVFVLILLSLAASGLSVSLQTQIDQLYQIYQATQNNIIQLNTEISLFNEQLANLRDMVKALKIGVSSDVVILLSDVGTLKNNEKETKANLSQLAETVSTQLSSVRYAMDVTNNNTWTKIKTVQSSVDTLNTDRNTTTFQLSSLQSSVDTLNTRVNSPVNLYQDCIQETKSCRKPAALTPIYHTSCATDYLPMNVTVSLVNYMHACKQFNVHLRFTTAVNMLHALYI